MIITLCTKDDFNENNMLEVIHENHSYLVAKVDKEYFAVDNMCSHENSELILGCLKDKTITAFIQTYKTQWHLTFELI